jgi:peptidyl-prolyl cis-trans isomerase SurA
MIHNPFPSGQLGKTLLNTLFLLLALHTAATWASVDVKPLDKVAAIVNDDVVTEAELQARLKLVIANIRKTNKTQLPPMDVLRKQVLDSMILERIQEQRAKQIGITIDDQTLSEAFAELANRNKMTPDQFRAALKKEGTNLADFMKQLRTQTAIQQLIAREVNSQVHITKEDVDEFMRKHDEQSLQQTEYNVSHILLNVPEKATPAEISRIRKRAEDIHRQLLAGKSFETLAIANSNDQYALKGGLLGWRKAGQLPELFLEALGKMKPGEVSPVLQSANGFHILKLNDMRGATQPVFRVTQTHARHILLRRQAGISDKYLRGRLEQLRQRILNGEDFGKIARAHSDDVASAVNDGDLGWVTPGAMVPSFEKAMDLLKPGQISPIVETPYGLHIIQVLGRREKDLGKEKLRADATRELHVRKAEEYYQIWIRRLRDQAYVEYLG